MFAEFSSSKGGKYGRMLLSFGGGSSLLEQPTFYAPLYFSDISIDENGRPARNIRLVQNERGGTELFALSYRRVMACCE